MPFYVKNIPWTFTKLKDPMTGYTFASNSIEAVLKFLRQCKGPSFEALLHLSFVHDVPIVCESLCHGVNRILFDNAPVMSEETSKTSESRQKITR